MTYPADRKAAAKRHLDSADTLFALPDIGHKAEAAYLYGLSGEMSLKELMVKHGMSDPGRTKPPNSFYMHFPGIKSKLRIEASARLHQPLLAFANDPNLFKDWDISMRYASNAALDQNRIPDWKQDAHDLYKNSVI